MEQRASEIALDDVDNQTLDSGALIMKPIKSLQNLMQLQLNFHPLKLFLLDINQTIRYSTVNIKSPIEILELLNYCFEIICIVM